MERIERVKRVKNACLCLVIHFCFCPEYTTPSIRLLPRVKVNTTTPKSPIVFCHSSRCLASHSHSTTCTFYSRRGTCRLCRSQAFQIPWLSFRFTHIHTYTCCIHICIKWNNKKRIIYIVELVSLKV